MEQNVKIVVGLQYGDEGKGLTVNSLLKSPTNSIVVRFNGGQQAGHTVHHNDIKHTCSNFGAGVLKGVPTYFTEHTTMYPVTRFSEEKVLNSKGIVNPVAYYHPRVKITTPWDVLSNQQCEDNNDHGTCGLGIGKTMKRNADKVTLHVIDLLHVNTLKAKLKAIEEYYDDLDHSFTLAKELELFMTAIQSLIIECRNYDVLLKYENIVFEGSQGVLLDMDNGVFPHVTYSNTTSKNALEVCEKLDLRNVEVYGVTRAYSTRHGHGPFIENQVVLKHTEHETNIYNPNQGTFKIASMDYSRLNLGIIIEMSYSYKHKFTLIVTCVNQVSGINKFDNDLVAKNVKNIMYSGSIYGNLLKSK